MERTGCSKDEASLALRDNDGDLDAAELCIKRPKGDDNDGATGDGVPPAPPVKPSEQPTTSFVHEEEEIVHEEEEPASATKPPDGDEAKTLYQQMLKQRPGSIFNSNPLANTRGPQYTWCLRGMNDASKDKVRERRAEICWLRGAEKSTRLLTRSLTLV